VREKKIVDFGADEEIIQKDRCFCKIRQDWLLKRPQCNHGAYGEEEKQTPLKAILNDVSGKKCKVT
jgi:hypothetical protein